MSNAGQASAATTVLEETHVFTPRYDANGLIPAIVTEASNGEILMLAYMNDDSLRLTLETKEAHFWSRSRAEIWRKGATSGNTLRVVEMRTDCDQDALLVIVSLDGGVACHTGRRSCFYRRINIGGGDAQPLRLTFLAD